ncbi:MAG TPA: metal ABC transporter substrate-binding protein [Planctomycetota bacterium]|nr:metal ABC transporter substrate-binding protein [Planctomycetota bacterium]
MRLPSIVSMFALGVLPAQAPEPLRVCATTPDLGNLAAEVGGSAVTVTTFVTGPQDAHFLEARPSMIRELNRADALVEVGLELEIGWLPLLVDNARNGKVLPGSPGRIDASTVIRKLEVPAGTFDRSSGDVHPGGNPHFCCDPLCGLRVAALLRDRFTDLRPDGKQLFAANYERFRERLCSAMVGPELAKLYHFDAEKLGVLYARGKLAALLQAQGDLGRLGGWFGEMLPWRGAKVVADHDLWPYFADRFGITVVGFFEPKPGIAPTTAHLEQLIKRMRTEQVRVILSAPYFAPQHAEFVARTTGAKIAAMAHQVGSREGCDDYLAFVGHDVAAVVAALKGTQ